MKNRMLILTASALLLAVTALQLPAREGKPRFQWSRTPMISVRTGCTSPSADNVGEALGTVKGKTFTAPNGKVYRKGCAWKVAASVIEAQKVMAPVKEVVGHTSQAMVRRKPECELSNLFVDQIMRAVEEKSGRKVDIGFANFGGIRVDMPKGDILLDDMLSMFPFKNSIVYVALKGKEIRKALTFMAADGPQVIGGMQVVMSGGELIDVTIGGQPLDDEKVYGLATISFLLAGGDGYAFAENAEEVIEFKDVEIIDVMLGHVKAETAAGREIGYHKDGRLIITYR